MPALQPYWNPGVLWGTGILVLIMIATLIGGIAYIHTDRYNRGWDALTMLGALAVEFALLLVVWFPFQTDYLKHQVIGGRVAAVSSRFLASGTNGGGSTQKFAVQLINGTVVGCNDTRCSLLKPGDEVELYCTKSWQWGGTAGWDCNWGAAVTKNGLIP